MTEEQKEKLETFIDNSTMEATARVKAYQFYKKKLMASRQEFELLNNKLTKATNHAIDLAAELITVRLSNNKQKKRYKNLQRRLSKEEILNKRLYMLLELVVDRIEDGKLKELVKFELQTMKWM